MRPLFCVLTFFVMFCLSGGALASVTVELAPVEDVSFRYSPSPPMRQNLTSRGAAPSIEASVHVGKGRGACSLLRFDLSSIPAGAKIRSARLLLVPTYTYPAAAYAANETLCIYQLAPENRSWVEGTSVSQEDEENAAVSVPATSGAYMLLESFTSDSEHNGTRWLNGNLIGAMDFQGDEIGRLAVSETGLQKDAATEIELAPQAIQEWLRDPALAEAGLVLWMRSDAPVLEQSRFAIFQSREGEAPPKLILEFDR